MDRYEILILTIPELTKDEESSLENQLEKFLNDHKGSIVSFDRWGKYRLAYPVRGNDYGVYFLMRFEAANDKDFLKELKTLFYVKFNGLVMRHVVTRLAKDQSLEYKKPPSLEDTPKKHIGFFDKGEMKPSRFDEKRKPAFTGTSDATSNVAEAPKESEESEKSVISEDAPKDAQTEQAGEEKLEAAPQESPTTKEITEPVDSKPDQMAASQDSQDKSEV